MRSVRLGCLALSFLLFSIAASSQPLKSKRAVVIPETPAGKQLSEWLKVFAAGDQNGFALFIGEHYSKTLLDQDTAVDRADRQARTYVDARSFDVRSIEKSTDAEIQLLAQSSLTDLWYRLIMKVEETEPYKITEYSAQRIHPPAGSMRKLTEAELIRNIRQFMNKLAANDSFSGTVMVAKDGEPVFSAAYGFAHKGYRIRNRLDTKLNIASMAKMFTAIAIMQLVEDGKLSLTDTIGKFLPNYPNKQAATRVTLHHLLSHTSGMGDFHGGKYVCQRSLLKKVSDFLPLFWDEPLSFEPGTRMQYSNAGYMVLGAIIEKVSGENFFDYIREHIFNPAGMNSTDYYESDRDTPNLAMGYTNFDELPEDNLQFRLGPRRNTSQYIMIKGLPAGGAFSTLRDILRFSGALRSHKLISAKSLELMTTKKVFFRKYAAGDIYYGYGFELENIDGKRVIGHGGGDLGISSGLRWYPESGNHTLIILSNYDRGGIITNDKFQELIVQGLK